MGYNIIPVSTDPAARWIEVKDESETQETVGDTPADGATKVGPKYDIIIIIIYCQVCI